MHVAHVAQVTHEFRESAPSTLHYYLPRERRESRGVCRGRDRGGINREGPEVVLDHGDGRVLEADDGGRAVAKAMADLRIGKVGPEIQFNDAHLCRMKRWTGCQPQYIEDADELVPELEPGRRRGAGVHLRSFW